jgi:hypothetical protein
MEGVNVKYKINATVKGSVSRPSYTGTVEIYTNEHNPNFQALVHSKLKRTSFPEIWKDDVKINKIEVMK